MKTKLGAIDIGSNAVRLLIMSVHETMDGPVFIKDTIYRVPLRLGEEAFLHGAFSDRKVSDLVKTISAFRNILEVADVVRFRACATSAMREASNGQETIDTVLDKTGIQIEIISGDEESEIIFTNHIERMDVDPASNYLYIDVGGGSTELILMNDGQMIDKWSFNIGTLRIKHDMVSQESWDEMRSWLYKFRHQYSRIKGVGSGGNINHILKYYSKGKNNMLSLDIIETCYLMLRVIPDLDKEIKLGMRPDRADVIVPALEIFRKVMNWIDMDEIYVPKLGLPEGIIKQQYHKLRNDKESA